MQFSELGLNPDLMRGIEELGFTTCTDVQEETFRRTLNGRDVAVQSQTGTGKTAAFLITIFQLMNESEQYRGTRALIVAPTRELAVQIENDAKALGKYLPQRTGCFYGGVGYGQQERDLAESVEIVIGTPGRLLDFNQSGKLDYREMGIIVIDEADRLFDMGFYPDIRKMMRRSRPRTERLTMLYSATLSVSVRNISWQFMNDPVEIEVESESLTVDTVDQELYHVARDEKFPLLLGLLRRESPRSAIIFCNTKRATEIIARKLALNGYHCDFIIGDLPQHRRLKIIERIKSGDAGLLTATDVAARGLHVDDLDLVVNYDLPEDPEAYVHRIGRTARAGKQGKAISLACERFVYSLEPIEELIDMRIPSVPVTDELLADDESEGKPLPVGHASERSVRGRTENTGRSRSRRGRSERSGAPRAAATHPHAPKHAAADAGADSFAKRKGRSAPAARPQTVSNERGGKREPVRADRAADGPVQKGPSRNAPMDDRLAYYREKYGEEFVAKRSASTGGPSGSTPAPKSAGSPGKGPGSSARAEPSGDSTAGGRQQEPPSAVSDRKPILRRLSSLLKRKR